jgi:hypothetical protein
MKNNNNNNNDYCYYCSRVPSLRKVSKNVSSSKSEVKRTIKNATVISHTYVLNFGRKYVMESSASAQVPGARMGLASASVRDGGKMTRRVNSPCLVVKSAVSTNDTYL